MQSWSNPAARRKFLRPSAYYTSIHQPHSKNIPSTPPANHVPEKASKRQTTRHRVKVERKIREHNRKLRKQSKKTPNKHKLKRKDPGVPNSLPFKDEILQEARRLRELKEQEKLDAKQRRKDARAKVLSEKCDQTSGSKSLTDLVKQAQAKTAEFEQNEEFVAEERERFGSGKAVEGSLKAYYKEFRKVIEAADVILEVLDARDPIGSRCPQVEQSVISAGANKKLVLVLNKIDLVPKENVEDWLKYLRNELPTVAFKSCTQTQNDNLSRSSISISKASKGLIKSSTCLGADVLLKLLANYSRSKDLKTAIRVGVVGFPNTGKSSIINSLKRSKACLVGNTPGVTKILWKLEDVHPATVEVDNSLICAPNVSMQEVQLDKNVRLLDCPGIVMATGDENSAHTILRNAVKIETIEDPTAPVEIILGRCRKDQMILNYKIPMYTDCNNFLTLLAKRFGMLKKGGLADINKAARLVLQDWNSGKITYYTQPPEQHTLPTHISSEVVSQMAKEFDIDSLTSDERQDIRDLKSHMSNAMVMESEGFTQGAENAASQHETEEEDEMAADEISDDEEKVDEMVTDENPTVLKSSKRAKKVLADVVMPDPMPKRKTRLSAAIGARSPVTPEDMQLNKARKKEFKRMKKQRRRADKLSDDLSTAMESGLGGLTSEDYDFKDY